MKGKVKIGCISFEHGHAFSYARSLLSLKDVQLVGLAETDERLIHDIRSYLGIDRIYSDYRDLLNMDDLDGVIVCAPNGEHRAITEDAARAGKHVLVEKPLANTAEDARAMVDICRAHNVILQTAFVCRYDPITRQAWELIQQGAIGEPLSLVGYNRGENPGGWFVDPIQSGGGAVIDHAVHIYDVMRWMVGRDASDVWCQSDIHFSPGLHVEDSAHLIMRFGEQTVGYCDCSWSRPVGYDYGMKILGTEGHLSFDDQYPTLRISDGHKYELQSYASDYDFLMVQDFVRCIKEGDEPLASGVDGLKACEFVDAAYQSAKTGQVASVG